MIRIRVTLAVLAFMAARVGAQPVAPPPPEPPASESAGPSWPYPVGGAVLLGAVAYFALRRRRGGQVIAARGPAKGNRNERV